jgi:hypothetical protein
MTDQDCCIEVELGVISSKASMKIPIDSQQVPQLLDSVG